METWKAILFGAVGTWLVAIFAIWGERLRSWLFKPGLTVGKGEFSGDLATHEGGQRARYYLVPVENPKRFPPAHEVQLVLIRIEKSGQRGPEILFDEIMPLSWVRQELYPLLTRTIGTGQRAALFFVQEDGLLAFTPALTPRGELARHFPREHRGPITLWATLRAVSIETDSSSMRLKIEWDGQWRSDKIGLSAVCRVTVDPPPGQ
jgi:hypothetical protein